MGKTPTRQYGIEWLRVWAMFFITFGHLYGHPTGGGAMSEGARLPMAFILPLGMGAVDCFILTTGYFGIRQERAISKVLSIYAELVFYGVAIACIFLFVPAHRAMPVHFLKSLFPLLPTTFNYWFVTKYLGLLLLSPFINRLLNSLGKRGLLALSAVVLFLNLSMFANGLFPWGSQYGGGWTLMWFICLYICGHAIRRFKAELMKVPKMLYGGVWILLYAAYVSNGVWHCLKWADLGYNSMFTFTTAVCLFLLAASLKNCPEYVIGWLSPGIFSVYILHSNYFIRQVLADDVLSLMQRYGYSSPLGLIVLTIAIFVISVFIDHGRIWLFRILHIDTLCQAIGARINSLCQSKTVTA